MKKTVIALAMAAGLLVATASGAVASTTEPKLTTGAGFVPAKASDYSTSRKNKYWNAVKRTEPDALIVGKKDIIEMGVSVCDLLRAGGTLSNLADLVYESDPIIEDILITSMAAAPVYLCPDQQYKFD